jgi:hypothetical protein
MTAGKVHCNPRLPIRQSSLENLKLRCQYGTTLPSEKICKPTQLSGQRVSKKWGKVPKWVRGEDQDSVPKAGNQIGQRGVVQWSLFTNEGNDQRRRIKVDAKNCGKLDLGWSRMLVTAL